MSDDDDGNDNDELYPRFPEGAMPGFSNFTELPGTLQPAEKAAWNDFKTNMSEWDAGYMPLSLDDFFFASTGYDNLPQTKTNVKLPETMPGRFRVVFDNRPLKP